jgi:tRNA threonylcarbamoyladenosine biosynthesis protein TsaB
MLLALDTATRLASVALHDGSRLISESTWHSAKRHTVELMPAVERMLLQSGVSARQLEAVAVSIGPGSFTGLRIAMSVAKGITLAGNTTLLGIPTLDVVAYPHRWQPLSVCALVQAGRGRVCWALYDWQGDLWQPATSYAISATESVAAEVGVMGKKTLFVGELLPSAIETLRDELGELASFATPAEMMRRAGFLAELGWAKRRRGERDDPASLTPIYLHEPGSPA